MEYYNLNNGLRIPVIGFGCYNAKGGDNRQMFADAIISGYTLFDTASFYGTERSLGEAIKDTATDRSTLFLQSKLWTDEMGYDNALAAVERTLSRLQTDYLDVYLIHWPKQYSDVPEPEWKELQRGTYRAMERMKDEGLIRGIGLSNFLPHHLENILNCCNEVPVVDQLEFHLGYIQERAQRYAAEKGLRVQAWSPLGRGSLLNNEIYVSLAEKYGVSVSQLALRFIYQYGIIPLPKSASPLRQKQNLDIFDFEISDDDFNFLACLPNTMWSGEHPDIVIPKLKSNFEQ